MRTLTILTLLTFLIGCRYDRSDSDRLQQEETERMTREAHQQVGMPAITNFTERKFMKQILELRDQEITTYSYFVDMNGELHFVCESIGFGLPYSVQFVNPAQLTYRNGAYGSIPQADPNGLFMPDGLSATWILCSDGEGGVRPVYSEPELFISPFRLD